jgi:hypothetical protein
MSFYLCLEIFGRINQCLEILIKRQILIPDGLHFVRCEASISLLASLKYPQEVFW